MLEKQIKEKDAEIARLKETVAKYQNMLFGAHSEKTKYLNIGLQLSLFGEGEQPEAIPTDTPTVLVSGHNRQQKTKKDRDDCIKLMIASGRFPVETKILDLPEEERSLPRSVWNTWMLNRLP